MQNAWAALKAHYCSKVWGNLGNLFVFHGYVKPEMNSEKEQGVDTNKLNKPCSLKVF